MSKIKSKKSNVSPLSDLIETISNYHQEIGKQANYLVHVAKYLNEDIEQYNNFYRRYFHELWEAKTIAQMIQQNILKFKKDPKYDKVIFTIEISNDFTGEVYNWDTNYKSLEFKYENSFEGEEDFDDADKLN
jgi:hypothetical protein